MGDQWERLKGKTYPVTLVEQLTALETDETLASYKKQREGMAKDPYRPIYHMSSLSSMGDPNGLCQWQRWYHLFYQFGPEGSDRCHWKGIDKIFLLFSRQCAVARTYPEREDSNGISLFSIGGEAQVVSLDVWQMRSIRPELKYREGM